MNLNIENPRVSKSKIDFPKIKRNIQIDPDLFITIPSNTIWDPESSNFCNRMAIVGETPPRYVTMDPFNFDMVFDKYESSDGDEILELDKIPCYSRSIQ